MSAAKVPQALADAVAEAARELTPEEKHSPIALDLHSRLERTLKEAQRLGAELASWRRVSTSVGVALAERKASDAKAKAAELKAKREAVLADGIANYREIQAAIEAADRKGGA